MIEKYEVVKTYDGQKFVYIIWATLKKSGMSLPRVFDGCSIGRIEAEQLAFNLAEWYGLPVEAETIMSHFNQELLK